MIQGKVDSKVGGAGTGRGRWAIQWGGTDWDGETGRDRRAGKGQEWGGEWGGEDEEG